MFFLVRTRGRRDKDRLSDALFKFFKLQRSVIFGAWQSKSKLDECLLARRISCIHTAKLWDRHVRLVDKEHEVWTAICLMREIRKKRFWWFSGCLAAHVSRVVFDTGAVSHLLDHGEIVRSATLDAFCLKEFAFCLKVLELLCKLVLDILDCTIFFFAVGDEVLRREDVDKWFVVFEDLARYRIDLGDALYDVPRKVDLIHDRVRYGHDVDLVAECAKCAAREVCRRTREMNTDQSLHRFGARHLHPLFDLEIGLFILHWRSETVDA